MINIKKALVSVSSKDKLLELCATLKKFNVQIIATSNTYSFLYEKGIDSIQVSKYTAFPEIINGRVKTLHPKVFGGILARKEKNEIDEINQFGIDKIDLVCVNLYPFEKISKASDNEALLLDEIDIGGVSLLRASAKNYKETVTIPSPLFYDDIIEELIKNNGGVSESLSFKLMKKTFFITSYYDATIFSKFSLLSDEEVSFGFYEKLANLKYGENPHQQASYWKVLPTNDSLILGTEQLNGKELSYNNILDSNCGLSLLDEFENPCCTIIKHNSPCGVAEANNITEAFVNAYKCDPVSAYGGIYLFNREIEKDLAQNLNSLFLEVIIAPSFSDDALEILSKKKNLRILKRLNNKDMEIELKSLRDGILLQRKDDKLFDEIRVITGESLRKEIVDEIIFGLKVVKYVKSNAIIITNNRRTFGIGGGQPNRVQSAKIALSQAGSNAENALLISDGFIPFKDTICEAANYGIKYVIEPGGSIRDQEVIDEAKNKNIILIFTGIRHFLH